MPFTNYLEYEFQLVQLVKYIVVKCHNPIFTPRIFSGIGTQNEATQTELGKPDRDPPHQKNPETGPEHISEISGRFDQV